MLKRFYAVFLLLLALVAMPLVALAQEGSGALIQTTKGNIVVEFFAPEAPTTVANFKGLVKKEFYDQGMVWHRVVPGFVIQTGDPTNTGMGGSGKTIPLEVQNKLSHNAAGVLAMARSENPNSASSQFYITLAPATFLDGKYAVFGRVIQGLEVLPRIKQGDGVTSIRLVDTSALPVEKDSPKQKRN
ncbi:MAG: peptidylprolyl isomerase [Vampirovibrionales bacterium]